MTNDQSTGTYLGHKITIAIEVSASAFWSLFLPTTERISMCITQMFCPISNAPPTVQQAELLLPEDTLLTGIETVQFCTFEY